MTLRLKGQNSGDVSLKAPATAGDNTITLPTSNGSADQFLKNSGTAGQLEFSDMVEDSSGRLLVGHSSSRDVANVAQPKIQIEGTNVSTSTLSVIRNSNDSGGPVLALSKTRGTSTGSSTVVQSGDTAGSIYFSGADGTDVNSYAAWIEAEIDGSPSGNDMPGRLVFSTTASGDSSPTERMSIDNAGIIFLGSSSSTSNTIANKNTSAKMELSGGGAGCGLIDLYGGFHSTSAKEIRMSTNSVERFKMNSSGHTQFRAATYVVEARSIAGSSSVNTLYSGAHSSTGFGLGTITYEVYTNGNVKNTNNSYGQLSDERLKENIINAPSQWDDIKSLQIRKYNFRDGNGYDTHTQIGLVAQEVETVCPGLVQETPVREDATPVLDVEGNELEATKSVLTSVLYMKAVKALQEAQTRIETLETQNTAQQTQIDDLLARVTALEAA